MGLTAHPRLDPLLPASPAVLPHPLGGGGFRQGDGPHRRNSTPLGFARGVQTWPSSQASSSTSSAMMILTSSQLWQPTRSRPSRSALIVMLSALMIGGI